MVPLRFALPNITDWLNVPEESESAKAGTYIFSPNPNNPLLFLPFFPRHRSIRLWASGCHASIVLSPTAHIPVALRYALRGFSCFPAGCFFPCTRIAPLVAVYPDMSARHKELVSDACSTFPRCEVHTAHVVRALSAAQTPHGTRRPLHPHICILPHDHSPVSVFTATAPPCRFANSMRYSARANCDFNRIWKEKYNIPLP